MKICPATKIEERVSFRKYTHEEEGDSIEGSGIADCILIGSGTIHVIDFKYGKGVLVDADHNPQLMLYALGAYEAYKILTQWKRFGSPLSSQGLKISLTGSAPWKTC